MKLSSGLQNCPHSDEPGFVSASLRSMSVMAKQFAPMLTFLTCRSCVAGLIMYHYSPEYMGTSKAERFPVGTRLVSVRVIGIHAATDVLATDSGIETPSSDGDKPRPY
jgi:hypothetical protein